MSEGDTSASATPSGSRPTDGAQEVSTLSGFDPSRVRLCNSRDLIRVVEQRWRKQYFDSYGGRWPDYSHWDKSPMQIGAELEAMNPDTATVADVEAIMGQCAWVTESCDFCAAQVERWFEIGDEPDYEARYVNACLPCVAHLGAIAIEAQRVATVEQGAMRSTKARAEGIAQTPAPPPSEHQRERSK